MKKILLLMTMAFIPSLAFTQIQKLEGTVKPDSAVLKLLTRYGEVFDFRDVAVRDAKRKELVSPAYFYHGMDGAPISLAGLTKRQTKNNFKVLADSVYDEVLYQYENTAILIFKEWQHLTDKGVEKESINSVLIVMGKENGRWVVIADIIGMKPLAKK
ncbi:MAG: hypothetical protein ACK5RG_08370 [Cyclobacteriaceae bacterium]|jgi:hypothetical protein|nr:hypothetical protein [Flammeovirgaceae bacterium]